MDTREELIAEIDNYLKGYDEWSVPQDEDYHFMFKIKEYLVNQRSCCSANGKGGAVCSLVWEHDGRHYDDILEYGWGHTPD